MKRITKAGATAAIAALAALGVVGTATGAGANVAVTDGVGFVGKGDVQTALGLANDAAMQDLFKSLPNGAAIKFTATVTQGNETRWSCSSGEQSRTSQVTQGVQIKATPNTNAQGKLSNGWNLNGRDWSAGSTYISGGYVGAPYVGYCPAGDSFGGFLPNNFPVTWGPLQVNSVDLPNTPIV